MPAPLASVCIPYRRRFPGDQRILSWVVAHWRTSHPDWEVVVSDMDWPTTLAEPTAPPFSRSAARNACARQASSPVLIFANSDTVPVAQDPDPLTAAVIEALADPDSWDLSARYIEADPEWTNHLLHREPGPVVSLPPPEHVERQFAAEPGQLGKPYAGLIVAARALHDRVGGWDESYGAGWGWEDTAYCDALANAAGRGPARSGAVVHLWHERRPEDRPNHPAARRNRQRWRQSRGRHR